jgi:hypothetical protein
VEAEARGEGRRVVRRGGWRRGGGRRGLGHGRRGGRWRWLGFRRRGWRRLDWGKFGSFWKGVGSLRGEGIDGWLAWAIRKARGFFGTSRYSRSKNLIRILWLGSFAGQSFCLCRISVTLCQSHLKCSLGLQLVAK